MCNGLHGFSKCPERARRVKVREGRLMEARSHRPPTRILGSPALPLLLRGIDSRLEFLCLVQSAGGPEQNRVIG